MIKKIFGTSLVASMFLTGIAAAQTTTATTSTTTPGVPNTGADLVVNVMILAVSALIAVSGALYLYMMRRA